jgi:transforming growth factor-beta-induced protein
MNLKSIVTNIAHGLTVSDSPASAQHCRVDRKLSMKKTICMAACLSLSSISASAEKNSVAEFTPNEADTFGWRVVDDSVMGGRSKGNIKVSEDGILNFSGRLSLENRGGFSSLRSGDLKLDLSGSNGLVARVKGDGRTYKMRFNTDARFRSRAVSFSADFKTKKDEWIEVKVPFDRFSGSFRGMSLRKETFDPGKITRIGLLLGDKKAGPFELQVDWIRTYGADSDAGKLGTNDIVSVALADGRFGTLAAALTEAKLVGTLQGKGPFTVFAPTDKAFSKLPKGTVANLLKPENRDKLQAVLTYHVLSGSVDLGAALSAKQAKTVQGSDVKIGFNGGNVLVNDAMILDANIKCSNGIIHVIDSVILPPKSSNDIVSVAKKAGSFKTLLAAVEAAGLVDALSGDQPVTVFAPTDAAFAALPKGTVASLLKPENRKQLTAILSLHAVSGKISAGDALNAKKAKALSGGTLNFGIVDGVFKVNGVTIVKTDIVCDNGVIHVIDAVILPVAKTNRCKTKNSCKDYSCKDMTAADSGKSALKLIETAIDEGVPAFNKGNPGKCADIYRDCMVAINKGCKVDPQVSKEISKLVERSEKMNDDTDRAWLLRSGLDKVYSALSGN